MCTVISMFLIENARLDIVTRTLNLTGSAGCTIYTGGSAHLDIFTHAATSSSQRVAQEELHHDRRSYLWTCTRIYRGESACIDTFARPLTSGFSTAALVAAT